MRHIILAASAAALILPFCPAKSQAAADQSSMMAMCNTYAAHHLHVSTSDITEVKYEGQRTDGTHAVNGSASNGQTFQCTFNKNGTKVVRWWHSAPTGCPADVSEADRYKYPDCN